jgi:hypothetical protein
MSVLTQGLGIPRRFGQKPLQTGKFVGILTALGLAIAGVFRIVNAKGFIGGSMLGDGQFLALILLPVVALGLVGLVCIETVVSGYRRLRSAQSLRDQAIANPGYLLVRSLEAGVAILGVMGMATTLPVLAAENTPAPAGVGIMLLLFAVGVGILGASLVRATAELFLFHDAD